jgi:hypothetical protein
MAERIQAPAAADILGVSLRKTQYMAAQGKLPGAAKIGQEWTFDPDKLRAFIRDREAAACQQTYSSAPAPTMPASPWPGKFGVSVYEQLISGKRKRASKASGTSKRKPSGEATA